MGVGSVVQGSGAELELCLGPWTVACTRCAHGGGVSGSAPDVGALLLLFPSTNGEGSAIFKGASRSRRCRLQFCEIKISLRLLHIEGRGLLDLVEIYPFSPSKRCAFDFRHPTYADHARIPHQERPPCA